jgi:DinB superfamily
MKKPEKNEYASFYETYVSLVNETDIILAMNQQLTEIGSLFSQMTDEKGLYAYAEGKWTIKQLLGHLIDGERVFAYRAFRISRGDATPLAGFDQDPYVENGNFNATKLTDLLEEFVSLRKSNILMFNNLLPKAWEFVGTASENKITTRALAFIMVGHIRHHVKILKEKYLA